MAGSARAARLRWQDIRVPQAAVTVVFALIVIGLGVGVYYTYNGGWETEGMAHYRFLHSVLPIIAAKHGNMYPLEQENKLRKKEGRPLLVYVPMGSKPPSAAAIKKAAEFQQKLQQWSQAHGLPAPPTRN